MRRFLGIDDQKNSSGRVRAPEFTGSSLPSSLLGQRTTRQHDGLALLVMLGRVTTVMFNTYREAVRARVLHGLFALAIATAGYATIVGHYTSSSQMRVVGDLGAGAISIYAVVVAIVIGATSLYRELELKTIFPILARPMRRAEYLVGKFLGIWSVLAVFVLANAGALLLALAFMGGRALWQVLSVGFGLSGLWALLAWRVVALRFYLPGLWASLLFVVAYRLAAGASDDRQVVVMSALLCLMEVGIVSAVATLFAAFSSPFLTAVCTLGVFIVGRSADTLAKLPANVFGEGMTQAGAWLSHVVPNLMVYVPPRSLLVGETTGVSPESYLLFAGLQALGWSLALLAGASLVFQRRDFV